MISDCTSIHNLTPDVLILILVKLPVKSLLCCKSVCKPWLSLISTPNFIISHLKHSITKPGGEGVDQTLIAHDCGGNSMYLLNLVSPQIKAPLGFPYSRGDYSFDPYYTIVGSYNGIVCVSVANFPENKLWEDYAWYTYNDNCTEYRNNPSTYLWNPATKHSKLIPPHSIRSNIMSVAMGFGFDPIFNDLKVLRVVYSRDMSLSAEVYSANTNVWRKVDPRPTSYPQYDGFDVCVNGLMCCVGSWGMMAFDLDKEVFTCDIQIPESSFDYCITDFNDSIAIITSKEEESKNIFKLWTLNDEACLHGGRVEASWTLMLMVDIDYPHRHVFGCLNIGDFLLFTDDAGCLLYDSRKKEARNIQFSIFVGKRNIIKYNESLVSIIGSKQVDWNAHEKDC